MSSSLLLVLTSFFFWMVFEMRWEGGCHIAAALWNVVSRIYVR